MKKYFTAKDIPFLLLCFFIPLILYVLTSSHSLMFDDAGEFALITKLGSIAHPPGTPAYIITAFIWTKVTALLGFNHIDALTFFASLCVSLSTALLYCNFRIIAVNFQPDKGILTRIICVACAIAFATAETSWAWANTIEVYSFQVLTMSVTLIGLVIYHFEKKKGWIFVAAAGIAAGLGNHHLTMICFLPFVPLFFFKNFLTPAPDLNNKKQKKKPEGFVVKYFRAVGERNFIILAGMSFAITVFFYGWMYVRAQDEYAYMFGRPETLSELIFHMKGGTYSKNITETSKDIISSRVPYFLKLTALQFFIFLPLLILGLIVLVRKKLLTLLFAITIYFLILFFYQLNNNQWSSTDAYMLLPFMFMSFLVFYGAVYYAEKFKAQYVLPLFLIIQVVYNYPSSDRKTYPVSRSLMDVLDKSAPKNSVILIADWSLLIQYYYYRIVENFRPDLVVLNYDFKFTYYRILPILYPEFYQSIKPEYDNFTNELAAEHPHQIRNTGCDLTTPALSNSFKNLLNKIEKVAEAQNRYLLTDPRAHYFYWQNNFYNPNRYVSGCFSSSRIGDKSANENFLSLDFEFMKSPMLYSDPAALDKLVDFQAMLDRYTNFYQVNNDSLNLSRSQQAHEKIVRMQRQMAKSMSFAYKVE